MKKNTTDKQKALANALNTFELNDYEMIMASNYLAECINETKNTELKKAWAHWISAFGGYTFRAKFWNNYAKLITFNGERLNEQYTELLQQATDQVLKHLTNFVKTEQTIIKNKKRK